MLKQENRMTFLSPEIYVLNFESYITIKGEELQGGRQVSLVNLPQQRRTFLVKHGISAFSFVF